MPSSRTEGNIGRARPRVRNGTSSRLWVEENGELLALTEGRWDVLLTSDRRIKYQQNMTGRQVSIVVLRAKLNCMKDLLPPMPSCAQALLSVSPGQIIEVGPL